MTAPSAPADCDPDDLKNSIISSAWQKAFSASSILPFIGPALSQSGQWATCNPWINGFSTIYRGKCASDPNACLGGCSEDATKAVQSKIDAAGAEYKGLVTAWQTQATSLIAHMSDDLRRFLDALSNLVDAKVQAAAEPLWEGEVLLGVCVFFIVVVLAFVVFYYK